MIKPSKYFADNCTQKYQALGFVKCRSVFARISGDVIQTFYLKWSYISRAYSVEFRESPLCMPQPFFLDAGSYELDEFIQHHVDRVDREGWTFDKDSDESVEHCIDSISNTMDLYLIPFFEACTDCKSSLLELLKLEELFDRNRRTMLHLKGMSDKAAPWQERSLFDYIKFYMALKSHNISYAYLFLNHKVNYFTTNLKNLDDPNYPRQPDHVREGYMTKLATCLEQLAWLDSGNFSNFENMLNSNEKQMIEFLAEKHPKILKTMR